MKQKNFKSRIEIEKTVTTKKLVTTLITSWKKIKGYDLTTCTLYFDVWSQELHLVHGKPEEFARYIKEVFNFSDGKTHSDSAAMYAWLIRDNVRYRFICLQVLDFYPGDYGTLAHEIHHFVHAELQARGVVYSEESEEVFAYYTGTIMEYACRALNELRKHAIKKLKKKKTR